MIRAGTRTPRQVASTSANPLTQSHQKVAAVLIDHLQFLLLCVKYKLDHDIVCGAPLQGFVCNVSLIALNLMIRFQQISTLYKKLKKKLF